MDNHHSPQFSCFFLCLILLATGCASTQNTTFQNLTARFNIIYNAERLLNDYVKAEEAFLPDDYNELLPVFKKSENNTDERLLDSVILKASTIINSKANSDFLDDAYFLTAEANFLKGNYFDAAEFYSYVYSNYPEETQLAQLSRINKARSLLLLNNVKGATAMLDSAFKYTELSKNTQADLFALKTQLLIAQDQFEEAEHTLSKALAAKPSKPKRQRWSYLLAQLQEKNNKTNFALKSYKRLKKNIAPSELAFHAEIKHSILYNKLHEKGMDEVILLRTFLNNNLYADYKGRIFYMMARIQEQRNEMTDALMSYKSAIKASTINTYQKGVAYNSLADIYFRSGFYKRALSYYDSSLASLPTLHPVYAAVHRKAEALNQLGHLFEKVNFEESLQKIAQLPEDKRQQEITEIIRRRSNEEAEPLTPNILLERDASPGQADYFYFNNPRALKQGAVDFEEIWGAKILKDSWRYQVSEAPIAEQTLSARNSPQKYEVSQAAAGNERRFEDYMNNLPISSDAMRTSNERIAASLYEIGVFYLNSLQDERQAASSFERLAGLFPHTSFTLPALYRLYLMKRQTEPLLAKQYEDIILTRYSGSEIASIIRNAESEVEDAALDASSAIYTRIYNHFANKQYDEVIRQINAFREREGSESISSQLDYLYIISMGYKQNPIAFEDALKSFSFKYAQDSLVTPLVRQHLEYIRLNRESFAQRPIALMNNNIDGSGQNIPEMRMMDMATDIRKVPLSQKTIIRHEPVQAAAEASNEISALRDSTPHYFVVNVTNATTNLSPSRFGIGQFNRSRYPELTIKHQLKVVNKENQLIFVGPFQDKEEAISYEARILPMIKNIMKIPAERYNTFVISQEGLGQLNTREEIQAHIEHTTKNIK